jgi:hypothetical protein
MSLVLEKLHAGRILFVFFFSTALLMQHLLSALGKL